MDYYLPKQKATRLPDPPKGYVRMFADENGQLQIMNDKRELSSLAGVLLDGAAAYLGLRAAGAKLDGLTDDSAAVQAFVQKYAHEVKGRHIIDFSNIGPWMRLNAQTVCNTDKISEFNLGRTTYWCAGGVDIFRWTSEWSPTGGDMSSPFGATGRVVADGDGKLLGITIDNDGGDYVTPPNPAFTSGTGAKFTVQMGPLGNVTGILMDAASDAGGSGYVNNEVVKFRKTPFGQPVRMYGGQAMGPGPNSGGKFIQLNQPLGDSAIDPGPSRIKISDMLIRGFGTGLDIHNHSYAETIDNVQFQSCDRAMHFRYNSKDSGEETKLYGCTFSGNNYCIAVESWRGKTSPNKASRAGTWIKVFGGSMDHSNVLAYMCCGAKISFMGTHFEIHGDSAVYATVQPFQVEDSGSVIRLGGQLVVPAASGRTIKHFARVDTPRGSGGLFFSEDWDEYNTSTTSGEWAIGDGTVGDRPNSCTSLADKPSCVVMSRQSNNKFADPQPLLATFVDPFQISDDGGIAPVFDTTGFTATATGNQVTVAEVRSGPGLTVGQTIYGPGVPVGAVITNIAGAVVTVSVAFGAAIGSAIPMWATTSAQYGVNLKIENLSNGAPYPTIATFKGTIAGNVLTVTSVTAGQRPARDLFVSWSGTANGAMITDPIDIDSLGRGTWRLSNATHTVAAETDFTATATVRHFAITKTGGASVAARADHYFDLADSRGRHGFSMMMRKQFSGAITITLAYAKARMMSNGRMQIYKQVAAGPSVTFTENAASWFEVTSALLGRLSPADAGLKGANVGILRFDLSSPGAGRVDVCREYVSV